MTDSRIWTLTEQISVPRKLTPTDSGLERKCLSRGGKQWTPSLVKTGFQLLVSCLTSASALWCLQLSTFKWSASSLTNANHHRLKHPLSPLSQRRHSTPRVRVRGHLHAALNRAHKPITNASPRCFQPGGAFNVSAHVHSAISLCKYICREQSGGVLMPNVYRD